MNTSNDTITRTRVLILSALFIFSIPTTAQAHDIVINELFPAGKGKHPDWIELYNTSEKTLSLDGYSLTDNARTPRKWVIPTNTIIRPHEYLLFLADKKNVQNHTNFKLDKGGEFLGLYDPAGHCVDSITFGSQSQDNSLGRYPDGTLTWFKFSEPSMKAPNTRSARLADLRKQSPSIPPTTPKIQPAGGKYSQSQQISITPPLTHMSATRWTVPYPAENLLSTRTL
jgi:hypothetical protein